MRVMRTRREIAEVYQLLSLPLAGTVAASSAIIVLLSKVSLTLTRPED